MNHQPPFSSPCRGRGGGHGGGNNGSQRNSARRRKRGLVIHGWLLKMKQKKTKLRSRWDRRYFTIESTSDEEHGKHALCYFYASEDALLPFGDASREPGAWHYINTI